MKKVFLFFLLLSSSFCFALALGQSGLNVQLSGNNGGLINGKTWDSVMLKGKVSVLFYVDPDSVKSNEDFAKKLQAQNFDQDTIQSIAIVNLGATWIPNFLIEQRMQSRQEEFPSAVYVADTTSYLMHKWGFKEDSTDVFIFDKKGMLIYKKFGKLSKKEIVEVIALIKKLILLKNK